jgi:hypothetical protein
MWRSSDSVKLDEFDGGYEVSVDERFKVEFSLVWGIGVTS